MPAAATPARCDPFEQAGPAPPPGDPTLPLPVFAEGSCRRCGGEVDADRYCTSCGMLQPRNADHAELDGGPAAAVSDRGLRHLRNEDAMGLTLHDRVAAAVVCDGVSTSARPDEASAAAAAAATAVLASGLERPGPAPPDGWASLLAAAVDAARAAAAAVPAGGIGEPSTSPSTTFVAAVIGPGTVAVANIGDSRAYWIGPSGSRLLTVDDSLAEMAIAAGEDPEAAHDSADAHVITRWLGVDSDGGPARVATHPVDETGLLVVCSDGLWNYLPAPDELAAAVASGSTAVPLALARRLVQLALDAGGHDNVTVAVILAGPDGVAPAGGPAAT